LIIGLEVAKSDNQKTTSEVVVVDKKSGKAVTDQGEEEPKYMRECSDVVNGKMLPV